jgi:hypothetical protein
LDTSVPLALGVPNRGYHSATSIEIREKPMVTQEEIRVYRNAFMTDAGLPGTYFLPTMLWSIFLFGRGWQLCQFVARS